MLCPSSLKLMHPTKVWEQSSPKTRMAKGRSSHMPAEVLGKQNETCRTIAAKSWNFWPWNGQWQRSSGITCWVLLWLCTLTITLWPTSTPRPSSLLLSKDGSLTWHPSTSQLSTNPAFATAMLMGFLGWGLDYKNLARVKVKSPMC